MKKKVFFIISSLKAGGSERVFWLLSQGFDKDQYDVTIVLLDSEQKILSKDLEGVNFIDLNTQKASRSFFKLYNLLKKEKPFTVFSTTDHINILVALVSVFVKVPNLIARASNIPGEMKLYVNKRGNFWNLFTYYSYKMYDRIVCQSDEMLSSLQKEYKVDPEKLVVIPNPVLYTNLIKEKTDVTANVKLIVVARLSKEKGIERLVRIMEKLPKAYTLTIVGDGPLRNDIESTIKDLKLESRVYLAGQSTRVASLISEHDVFVLGSFTEGFPNVVLEALAVGAPVVAFRVGGISNLIQNGFNGYIVEQGDIEGFVDRVTISGSKKWDSEAIKQDVYNKCALDRVASEYEALIS